MKVTLEFDTSDFDEKVDYELASNGAKYHRALQTFADDILRQGRKYNGFNGRALTEEENSFICKIEEEFYRILEEYGANLELGE